VPTSTQLFRYSALTFNGHRIHYDLDYCRNVEGYDHLVVHGPLSATLLAELGQTVTRTAAGHCPGRRSRHDRIRSHAARLARCPTRPGAGAGQRRLQCRHAGASDH
jgi:acyl dehydratase